MHLGYSTSTYKGRTYKSYTIAESQRDGKSVRKRTIWRLGKLTEQQAEQIKLILEVMKSDDQVVTRLKDIVVQETRAYLDIAVVNDLWDQWQLDGAFNYDVTDSALPTHTMSRILTINRCTDPCSHYPVPMWAEKTALREVLGIDLSGLNDDKIYYELDKIHNNKASIENYLFKRMYSDNPGSFDFLNYDLTTTYFIGFKCNLSAFGKGKVECHGRRQVLLGVLINDDGYPFKWDVFPGNTAEVKTLETNINACKTRFGLGQKNVTLVFDRGIISEDNANLIEDAQMKYISALDRNQIPGCGVSLESFKELEIDQGTEPLPTGFKKYDDQLYFEDAGIIAGKRYVVGFNPMFFKEDRNNRNEKIALFLSYLKKENKDLKTAQRDRDVEATKSRVVKELKRLKIKKYFDPPVLSPMTVQAKLKNGTVKDVKSFQVQINKKTEVIEADKLLDGVCVFVTNHTETQGRGFKVKPQSIIKAYREKTKIEDVFKNVKSFLKLRPFFVNTEAHVKAVYTICILAYFINRYLANQRRSIGEKDYLNSKELYAPFKDIDIATLEDSKSGYRFKKAVKLPASTKALLEKLSLRQVAIDHQK
ncbi:MAG: IS1634 family transposase [Desulfobacteraceae bacterium]|nr:MAG: IS1634 family transposase [Desulfobacteraceae bacterium]